MAKSKSVKTQIWLVILGLGLLTLLLYGKRDSLSDTVEAIKDANIWLVLLLPVLQFLNFASLAGYYKSMLGMFKEKMGLAHLWGVVAALEFVGQILPSGGMSGLAYLVYGFRNKVSGGVVGLMQLGRYVLSLSSYFILSPLVLLMVVFSGQTKWLSDTVTKAFDSSIAVGFILGFLVIAIVTLIVFTTRKHSASIASKIERLINKVVSFFRHKRVRVIKKGVLKGAMHDFHDGFDFIKSKRMGVFRPFGFIFLNTFFQLAIVYTAFQAIGGDISVGVLFISFIAAQIAGVVSIIPGDVGVHESVMILMLSSLGIPDATAISATLLYRIFNKMIFLPIGFYFYTRLLNPPKEVKA